MKKENMKVLAARKNNREKELEKLIRKASDAYYNTGKTVMSDREFDKLVEELKEINPKSVVLDEIGAPVKKQKVKLPYFLGSLDKIKDDNADTWLQNNSGNGFFVSDKLDGVSVLLVYSREGIKAYTRGNGTYGQDISYLVPYLKIPQLKTNLVLRAEIIMRSEKFKAWKKKFENPRNLVSGLVNRKKVHKATKDVDVVVYEQLYPRAAQSQSLKKLKAAGFSVVPGKVYSRLTSGTLADLLKKRKASSKYEIDGLVVAIDKNNPVNTSGNPKWAVAFKSTGSMAAALTEVVAVHWKISKNGLLKPRVEVKPVRLSGVTVKFATGFNAKFIKDNRIGPGAKINIVRSGDVIPYITEVTKKASRAAMPSTSEYDYEWTSTKVDLKVKNMKEHDTYHVKRISYFLKTIGVENVSEGLVSRFMDNGLNTIAKVTKAKKEKFLQVPGVKDTLATKIHTNIQKQIKDVPLARLMAASGYFPNMAEKRLKVVVSQYPKVLDDYKKLPSTTMLRKIMELEGFSQITAKAFLKNLPRFDRWISKNPHITFKTEKRKYTKKGKLSGKQIVFTGYRDKQAEILIEQKGGTVGSGVSSKTDMLVVKDKSKTSTKITKAQQLGVRIMDANEFQRWLSKQ